MNDFNQLSVPESFVALYIAPGQYKPSLDKTSLFERFEFCDDLANALTEHARNELFDSGAAEQDVLERCRDGLLSDDSGVSAAEAHWVVGHLAELLQWAPLSTSTDY